MVLGRIIQGFEGLVVQGDGSIYQESLAISGIVLKGFWKFGTVHVRAFRTTLRRQTSFWAMVPRKWRGLREQGIQTRAVRDGGLGYPDGFSIACGINLAASGFHAVGILGRVWRSILHRESEPQTLRHGRRKGGPRTKR